MSVWEYMQVRAGVQESQMEGGARATGSGVPPYDNLEEQYVLFTSEEPSLQLLCEVFKSVLLGY